MTASCALRQTLLSLAVLTWSVAAVYAQGVGAIAGTVTDASGAVLPGASVTLTSAQGTVGGNREVFTDERGGYQFVRLVPGTYSVKAVLQGFRPYTQAGISVNSELAPPISTTRTPRSSAAASRAVPSRSRSRCRACMNCRTVSHSAAPISIGAVFRS